MKPQQNLRSLLVLASLVTGISLSAQEPKPQTVPLQSLITTAYKAGQKSITIPAGVYRVAAPKGAKAHLELNGLSDFVIDARGVIILFDDPTVAGILFTDCRNVTLRGATVEYGVSPTTQGVVEAISADGRSYDVQLDERYPVNLDNPKYFKEHPTAYLADPKTRLWKKGAYDLQASGTPVRLGDRRFRIQWSAQWGSAERQPVAVGDLIAFRGAGKKTFTLNNTAGMRLEDVTIYNSPGMALMESGGDGGNYYRIQIRRGPRLGGATTDPLLSSTADGIHSRNVRKGPTIENSFIEATGDDAIAIHGTFSIVFAGSGNKVIVNSSSFRPGDPFELFDAEGVPTETAVVQAVAPAPDFHNTGKSSRKTFNDKTGGPYVELTLDHPVKAQFDDLADNPAAVGAGFVVRNNKIMNHHARDIMLKSHDGVIDHNVFDGATVSSILLEPMWFTTESGYDSNITISRNIFRNTGDAPQSFCAVGLFALSGKRNDPNGHPLTGYGHHDITFLDNRFENIDTVNLMVTSARNVLIKGNVFVYPQARTSPLLGVSWGEDPGAVIVVAQSKAVRFEGNEVNGWTGKKLVQTLPGAEVVGVEKGIRVVP